MNAHASCQALLIPVRTPIKTWYTLRVLRGARNLTETPINVIVFSRDQGRHTKILLFIIQLLLPPLSLPKAPGRPVRAVHLILFTHPRLRRRRRSKWITHDNHSCRTRTRSRHRTRTRTLQLLLLAKYPTSRFLVLCLALCERTPRRRGRPS